MARKITPNLEKDVLAKAAEGMTTRAIAAWLNEAHGVKVTHVRVAALLKATRETRADVAASVTREALRPHVTSDLERLDEIRKEVAERRAKAGDCSHLDFVRLAQLETDIIERRLKLAGAAGGDAAAQAVQVDDETLRRMAREVVG